MKKILTLISLAFVSVVTAQNGSGNLHIFNDNTLHTLDLNFTVFADRPTTCNYPIQALNLITLPSGGDVVYGTFANSTTVASHPYPIDSYWINNTPSPPPPAVIGNLVRWNYIKFELTDPANPGVPIIPTLGGSVGFYCGISSTLTVNVGSYSLFAQAFTFAGEQWIVVQ